MKAISTLAVAVLLATGARAFDSVPSPLQQFKDANQAIQVVLDAGPNSGTAPPMLSDPASAAQIDQAFDVSVLAGLDPTDIATYLDVCKRAQHTEELYAGYGLPAGIDFTQMTPEQLQAVGKVAYRFQDEMALAVRFTVSCFGGLIPSVANFMQKLPSEQLTETRRHGIEMMKNGELDILKGAILSQIDPITPANRQIILDAVMQYLDAYIPNIGLADRRQLIGVIDGVSASKTVDDSARAKLVRMRQAMSSTDCQALCAF